MKLICKNDKQEETNWTNKENYTQNLVKYVNSRAEKCLFPTVALDSFAKPHAETQTSDVHVQTQGNICPHF
jgi:hypothetical protein